MIITRLNSAKTGTPLVLIHPIHGQLLRLYLLAQKIEAPVFGFHVTDDLVSTVHKFTSIKEIANYYGQIAQATIGSPFVVVGHCWGCLPAIEIARELGIEAILMDPPHNPVKTIIERTIRKRKTPQFPLDFKAICESLWIPSKNYRLPPVKLSGILIHSLDTPSSIANRYSQKLQIQSLWINSNHDSLTENLTELPKLINNYIGQPC